MTAFLSALAMDGGVGAATQNQAASALLFLYRRVLGRDPGAIEPIARARKGKRLPVVLERREVAEVVRRLAPPYRLIATLLYGSGLRLSEVLHLRLHDVELDRREIMVRGGKGDQDRVTMLPEAARADLIEHAALVRAQHKRDCAKDAGWVDLPDAVARKYLNAPREPGWQWLFPATRVGCCRAPIGSSGGEDSPCTTRPSSGLSRMP